MYCTFAREMVDSFGEAGEKALIRAIQAYGRARGERLRERHLEQGLPVNMRSLFEHYDLPGHPDTRKERIRFTDDELVSCGPAAAATSGCSTAGSSTTRSGRRTART